MHFIYLMFQFLKKKSNIKTSLQKKKTFSGVLRRENDQQRWGEGYLKNLFNSAAKRSLVMRPLWSRKAEYSFQCFKLWMEERTTKSYSTLILAIQAGERGWQLVRLWVRKEWFNLNRNEALYYSLISIKTISSPYKSNWISSVKLSKETFSPLLL